MASDGDSGVSIQNEFRQIRHIKDMRLRIDREARHLLDRQNQFSTGAPSHTKIQRRLIWLAQRRRHLDDEEAYLRNQSRVSAGSPASSSPETGVEEHVGEVRNNDLGGSMDLSEFWLRVLNDDTSYALESADSGVEEHAIEVSNTEPGGTSTDLSEFGALMLNDDTSYAHESADKVEEHAGKVSNTELGGTRFDMTEFWALMMKDGTSYTLESVLGRVEEHTSDVSNTKLGGTSMDLSEFDTSHTPESANSETPRKYWPPRFLGTEIIAERQAERELAERQAQSLQARGHCTYASKEEIARNAKEWMSEEAMVAFRRYIESEDDLKDIEYEFGELLHQCFNVEHYFKIFHHFNFTVKIKKRGSDWTLVTYFAEVISILQTKHYVCYPLDPDENGQCYACQNQGMHKLRHPSADIFECGNEDTTFPYYYEDSDSDGYQPSVGGSESDDDMS